MPLTALIDGEVVELSPEEEAAFLASLPPPVVPDRISKLQAELYLHSTGQLSTLLTKIAAKTASGDLGYDIYWRSASHFERSHIALAAIAYEMSWSPEQVDAMFIDAAKIV